METTLELLLLNEWNLVQWKIVDIHTRFIWIFIFFVEAFKYGDDVTFWGYVETNAKPLGVQLFNFVQRHNLVNYLTCYC
jgi:hypothetical protein